MSGKKPLAYQSDICFLYDGSLAGFYCCVHECVYEKQLPMAICADGQPQPLLLSRRVETDAEKALHVRSAVRQKISPRALELVESVFLTNLQSKELHMLRFLLRGFREGGAVTRMISDPDIAALTDAEMHLGRERHLLLGFIRFSDYDGKLVATIKPKNFVLPTLHDHFVTRFPNEDFMIYDRTHKAALMYENKKSRILFIEELPAFEASPEETRYRTLWKQFYHTLSIEERYNPLCRRTHMPKRYWSEMTEMKELL